MSHINLQLENVETQTALDPVLPGDYLAMITDSSIKVAPSGVSYIKLTWKILSDGPHKGRLVWENISITNPHNKTYDSGHSPAEIGARKVKTIAVCGNHPNPNYIRDTEELHGLQVIIRVVVSQSPGYPPQNDVKGYKKHDGQKPAAGSFSAPAPTPLPMPVHPAMTPAPQPQPQKPPWMP